ncbi:unnamed protein product [Chrysoparadoxa australica]
MAAPDTAIHLTPNTLKPDSLSPLWLEMGELSSDLVFSLDARTCRVMYCNRASQALLSRPPEEVVGSLITNLVLQEDRELLMNLLTADDEQLASSVATAYLRSCRPHGTEKIVVYVESRWRCKYDEHGIPQVYVVVMREVSEEKWWSHRKKEGGTASEEPQEQEQELVAEPSSPQGRETPAESVPARPDEYVRASTTSPLHAWLDMIPEVLLQLSLSRVSGEALIVSISPAYCGSRQNQNDLKRTSIFDLVLEDSHEDLRQALSSLSLVGDSTLVDLKLPVKVGAAAVVTKRLRWTYLRKEENDDHIVCVDLGKAPPQEEQGPTKDSSRRSAGSHHLEGEDLSWGSFVRLAELCCDYVYCFAFTPQEEDQTGQEQKEAANLDMHVVHASRRACEMLGVQLEELADQGDLKHVVERDKKQVTLKRQRAVAHLTDSALGPGVTDEEEDEGETYSHVYCRRSANGGQVMVEANYFRVGVDPSGAATVLLLEKELKPASSGSIQNLADVTRGQLEYSTHLNDLQLDPQHQDATSQATSKRRKRSSRRRGPRSSASTSLHLHSNQQSARSRHFYRGYLQTLQAEQGRMPMWRRYLINHLGLENDDVNAPVECVVPELRYPLVVAAAQDDSYRLSLLLALGADCNQIHEVIGFGALHMAVMCNSHQCVTLLIAHGAEMEIAAEVDDETATPLQIAVKEGYTGLVTLLLDMGANVNVRDHQGNTPLHSAVELDHAPISKELLTHGADVMLVNFQGFTPAALVDQLCAAECAEAVKSHARAISEDSARLLLAENVKRKGKDV